MVLNGNEYSNALYNANHRELHVSTLMGFCYYSSQFCALSFLAGINIECEKELVLEQPHMKQEWQGNLLTSFVEINLKSSP